MGSGDDLYYPNIAFADGVLADELEEINRRKIVDIHGKTHRRGDCEVLDIDQFTVPENQRSKWLNQIISELDEENNLKAWQADENNRHGGLIGLAFSGGGIRSATVNLGVLQGLKKSGLLKCVDYLSTVSGGGYIGSCLTSVNTSLANLEEPSEGAAADACQPTLDNVFNQNEGVPEASVARHLRNNANYMAPNGLIDFLRVPCIFLRGMLINFFVVLPYVILLSVVSALLIAADFSPAKMLSGWLLSHGIPFGGPFVITQALAALLLLLFFFSAVIVRSALFFADSAKPNSGWGTRDKYTRLLGILVASLFAAALIEFQPLAIDFYSRATLWGLGGTELILSAGIGTLVLSLFVSKLLPQLSSVFGRLGLYSFGLLGGFVFWGIYLHLSNILVSGPPLASAGFVWQSPLGFIAIALALIVLSLFTGDANFTGISRFYRDRLSQAYIVAYDSDRKLVHRDILKLSEMDTTYTPYQLLNATLNLDSTKNAYKRDLHGDFFFFSKRYIGSATTGYCSTKDMEASSRNINLATAMAISAAAAAPNMGKNTVKILVFILAMLNIRYDYWLPNPSRLKRRKTRDKRASAESPVRRVGPWYFIRELFGSLNAKSAYINLSDGGHIENLGVYELIRRECRLIIVGDSEADPELTYGGLADVIRLVSIDFGVRITMHGLDDIRKGKQHHAIGTIHYRNNKMGKILYLKTSLLGALTLQTSFGETAAAQSRITAENMRFDSNPYVVNYKRNNPDFPHQSSSNQFFNESQFESYRALGYQMVKMALLAPESVEPTSVSPIDNIVEVNF